MNEFPAHIKTEQEAIKVQSAQEHCRQTAAYASKALASVRLENAAYLAGLMHDCGKFKQEFGEYLWAAYRGEAVQRGSVNHTFAGCRMLLEHFHKGMDPTQDMTCEFLAYAVGAHHGQFDCIDDHGKSGFYHHQTKEGIGYEESEKNFLALCADWPEIEALFQKSHSELSRVYAILADTAEQTDDQSGEQLWFSAGQLARLLLSAVIEGDRRDTAEFMNGLPQRSAVVPCAAFWKKYLLQMEKKLQCFAQDTAIQIARSQISDLCREAAQRPCGIYRLNVPTGGGKTLSSLRYALAHAAQWNKDRIIFVTPLLTILEQNAAVIRNFIEDDSIILEHHSNVLEPENTQDALDLQELAVDSWDAPIIITTLVQLLNTMFLGKTTSIRRYQALCNAVVVIDEVQTVPTHMLSLFNTALNFLSTVCGTTFLLCSATQPCFDKADHPLILKENSELIPSQQLPREPFKRTVIEDAGQRRLEEIPAFAEDILEQTNSLLIICNKKAEAEFLFRQLSSNHANCFHLSSAMCMSHRRDVLKQLELSLEQSRKTEEKTICVATQVMEAGVDISFGCVIRLTAGMDSVIQSAGRCNRNGESAAPAPVYVLQCSDEKLGKLWEINAGKQASVALLEQFRRDPEKLGGDLASDFAIEWYYRKLYKNQDAGHQQYTIKDGGNLFDLLSTNSQFFDPDNPECSTYNCRQAFKTAGALFHALDNAAEDVVVPYGEGAELITELTACTRQLSPVQLKDLARRAKPYTVSLYDYQKEMLGAGVVKIQGFLVLRPEYYDLQTGLTITPQSSFLEV